MTALLSLEPIVGGGTGVGHVREVSHPPQLRLLPGSSSPTTLLQQKAHTCPQWAAALRCSLVFTLTLS